MWLGYDWGCKCQDAESLDVLGGWEIEQVGRSWWGISAACDIPS